MRSYINLVESLPWVRTEDKNRSLVEVREILDKNHHGLDSVKDEIMEFLAVNSFRKEKKGRILCLVGPPGTGKTSIAKAVAKALGRKDFLFSAAGLKDYAEIKGHRRTYIGAYEGQIINALKTTQTSNPVIIIDGIIDVLFNTRNR